MIFVKLETKIKTLMGGLTAVTIMGLGIGYSYESSTKQDLKQHKQSNKSSKYSPPSLKNINSPLEKIVDSQIKKERELEKHIDSSEKTAWSVFNFKTGEKLVSINEDSQFQAASLIKPLVAVALYKKIDDGTIKYGPKTKKLVRQMIHYTNNKGAGYSNLATSNIMKLLGGPEHTEKILKTYYPQIFKQTKIVEYIPWSGKTYKNKASAHDYSRFLYALWHNQFPRSKELKNIMGMSGSSRSGYPSGAKLYDKTGTTGYFCGYITIVDKPKSPYTFIGLIERDQKAKNYGRFARTRGNLIREVSKTVNNYLVKHNGVK